MKLITYINNLVIEIILNHISKLIFLIHISKISVDEIIFDQSMKNKNI